MKNNFRFIFPRLIGATVIVGIAALIITTLFKLMLGLVLIGGVAVLIRRMAGKSGRMLRHQEYGQMTGVGFGPMGNRYDGANHASVSAVPVQKQTTIVPIN